MIKKLIFLLALVALPVYRDARDARADIAADDSRDTYTGNGTTTIFTYNFKVLTNTNIAVYKAGVLQTLTTHYTLTGVNNDAGGTVVFLVAPATGEQVLLMRNQPINQTTSYIDGSISASTIERDFDRQTSINQQQQEEINRGLKYPRTITPTPALTELPPPVAGKVIGYSNDATSLELYDRGGGGGGGGFTPTTSAELAGALNDETGTDKAVFSDSPTFTTNITTPKVTLGTCLSITGAGSPEGVVTAPVCSTYQRTDGGVATTFYSKATGTGNTGWEALGNPAGSGAPTTVPFITTVPDGGVSGEFAMSLLGTGLYRNTAGTGIPTIATPCTHYLDTTCVLVNGNLPTVVSGRIFDNSNSYTGWDTLWWLQDNVDPTKQMQFQLSGITTGTTVTLTPPNANTHLLGGSHFAGTHAATLRRTGSATYAACRDNDAATVDPVTTDDTASSYCIGSRWTNTAAIPRRIYYASDVTASAAVWLQSGVAATPPLTAVLGAGRIDTTAVSFATAVRFGGWAFYDDVSLGPIFTCVVLGVENDCNWSRTLATGKVWSLKNSGGTDIITVTEATGAVTNLNLNAESTGNVITIPYEEWKEVAACNNTTPALIFNANTAASPAAVCEGTNTRLATADFDDSTDEGFDFSWMLPSYFTAGSAIDWMVRWKAAATSGAAGWCVQMVRVPAGATSDPALPAKAAGNCTSTTVAGTTLQEVVSTITGATCTGCVANDRLNVRVSRNATGSAVTDSLIGDSKMLMIGKRWRETK